MLGQDLNTDIQYLNQQPIQQTQQLDINQSNFQSNNNNNSNYNNSGSSNLLNSFSDLKNSNKIIQIIFEKYIYLVYHEAIIEDNLFGPVVKVEKKLKDDNQSKITYHLNAQLIRKKQHGNNNIYVFEALYNSYKAQNSNENEYIVLSSDEPVLSSAEYQIFIWEEQRSNIYKFISRQFYQKYVYVESGMLKPIIKRIIACYKVLYEKKKKIYEQKVIKLQGQGLQASQDYIIHGNITPATIVVNNLGKIRMKYFFQNECSQIFLTNLMRNIKFWPDYIASEVKKDVNLLQTNKYPFNIYEKFDIYSLGVIFYKILFQKLPEFDEQTGELLFPQKINCQVGIENLMKKLLQKCLNQNIVERISAQDLFNFLEPKEITFVKKIEHFDVNNKFIVDFQNFLFQRNQAQFINKILQAMIEKKHEFLNEIKVGRQNFSKYLFLLAEKQRLIYNKLLLEMLQFKENNENNNEEQICQDQQIQIPVMENIQKLEQIILKEILEIEEFLQINNFKINLLQIIKHQHYQCSQFDEKLKNYLENPEVNSTHFQTIYDYEIAFLVGKMGQILSNKEQYVMLSGKCMKYSCLNANYALLDLKLKASSKYENEKVVVQMKVVEPIIQDKSCFTESLSAQKDPYLQNQAFNFTSDMSNLSFQFNSSQINEICYKEDSHHLQPQQIASEGHKYTCPFQYRIKLAGQTSLIYNLNVGVTIGAETSVSIDAKIEN